MPVADDEKPLQHKTILPETALESQIEAAAAMISYAKNPVILAGSGVIRSKAAKQLTAFAEN